MRHTIIKNIFSILFIIFLFLSFCKSKNLNLKYKKENISTNLLISSGCKDIVNNFQDVGFSYANDKYEVLTFINHIVNSKYNLVPFADKIKNIKEKMVHVCLNNSKDEIVSNYNQRS